MFLQKKRFLAKSKLSSPSLAEIENIWELFNEMSPIVDADANAVSGANGALLANSNSQTQVIPVGNLGSISLSTANAVGVGNPLRPGGGRPTTATGFGGGSAGPGGAGSNAGANVNAGNGIGVANSFGVGINLPGAGIQQSFGNSQTTAQNFRPRPQPFGK